MVIDRLLNVIEASGLAEKPVASLVADLGVIQPGLARAKRCWPRPLVRRLPTLGLLPLIGAEVTPGRA